MRASRIGIMSSWRNTEIEGGEVCGCKDGLKG